MANPPELSKIVQQFNSSTINNDQNLPPLRKNIRVRPFRGLLVREGEAHRRHESLFEEALQRLPVQRLFGGNQWKVKAYVVVHSDL